MKTAYRFYRQNRYPISKQKSITDFSGSIFNRDHHRDYHLQITIRFSKQNRNPASPVLVIQGHRMRPRPQWGGRAGARGQIIPDYCFSVDHK
jgi:hypothetical protein